MHELYFGNLGGDGKMPETTGPTLEEHFGSVAGWRREFVGAAQSLAGGSGWVLLTYSRRTKQLWNQVGFDDSQAAVDAAPVLALDMYEHAYQLDFGANATAYIDAFIAQYRLGSRGGADRRGLHRSLAPARGPVRQEPAVVVGRGARRPTRPRRKVQLLDARPRHYISRAADIMGGAPWRDPDRVEEWAGELSADQPVAVYCAYGRRSDAQRVGDARVAALRERPRDRGRSGSGRRPESAAGLADPSRRPSPRPRP
jgi:superoxide dismutase, Fe-Mn family